MPVFPNLARRNDAVDELINQQVQEELRKAGIEVCDLGFKIQNSEVPTSIMGVYKCWEFERRWRYYVAKSDRGIPPQQAEEFNKTWGDQVRVEGHCGCPSPLEHCGGFAVGSYHIDTQEGLNAFVELLKSISTK